MLNNSRSDESRNTATGIDIRHITPVASNQSLLHESSAAETGNRESKRYSLPEVGYIDRPRGDIAFNGIFENRVAVTICPLDDDIVLFTQIDEACWKTLPAERMERLKLWHFHPELMRFSLLGYGPLSAEVPFDLVSHANGDPQVPLYNHKVEFLLFTQEGKQEQQVYIGMTGQHKTTGPEMWDGRVFAVVDFSLCPEVLQKALLNGK